MTDEIDIEEHDVMDNPMIRRIFPDLSVIKNEISKYYEEGPDTKLEPVSEPLVLQTEVASDSPCDEKRLSACSHYSDIPDIPNDNYSTNLQSNVIILGSKPNKLCTVKKETMIEHVPKVTLQNICFYLNKSKTYCKDCMVLFPNHSELEAHKNMIHDQGNKTLIIKKKELDRSVSPKTNQCNVCLSVFSSKGNLTKHLKNIHHIHLKSRKTKNNNEKSDYEDIRHKDVANNNESNDDDHGVSFDNEKLENISHTGANCFHCHKVFPTQKALVDHLYKILEPNKIECKQCTMKFSNPENLEKHVKSMHNDNPNSFECYKCAIKFLSKDTLDKHNQNKHKIIRPKPPETDNAIDSLPIHCQSVNDVFTKDDAKTLKSQSKKSLKRLRNESKSEESSDDEDIPVMLLKRLRSATVRKSDLLEGVSEYNLKNKNEGELNKSQVIAENRTINVNLKKQTDIKSSVSKKYISDKNTLEEVYKCSICSCYMLSFRNYGKHMSRYHKMEKVSKVQKVLFDSKCQFCVKEFNMNSYNKHISTCHEEKKKAEYQAITKKVSHLDQKIKAGSTNEDNKSIAFKSLLYKCLKCDIYFLTAKRAMNHLEHMELLINWKCCICNRIFKIIDKDLHMKQHINSHSFTVHNITCVSDFNKILYLCLKCTIYFSEDSFVRHHVSCGIRTPKSVYCKVCDCLIGSVDFDSHDEIHAKNKKMNASDFTIVETELIIDNDSGLSIVESKNDTQCSPENSLKNKIRHRSRLYLAYCNLCQSLISYVSKFGVSAASRKVHIEARCMHVKKQPCKICGIVVSAQTVKVHRKLHLEVEDLNVQNFSFFELVSKKPMRPPIPEYPSCNICHVQFLSRNDVKEHECNGYNYVMCHVCQIKLSKEAFKFHMQFHEYSMGDGKELSATAQVQSNTDIAVLNTTRKKNEFVESKLLYSCNICKITFDAYDPVIKHCQSHYDRRKEPVAKQSCQFCGLNFDETYCKVHEDMHSHKKIELHTIKMINFDPFYFCLDHKLWLKHIFASLTDDEMRKILSNSIYRFESRLKMEVFQAGPSKRTLYKCEKCLIFVHPDSLYVHAENSQCTKLEKFPCIECGLCFDSAKHKMTHEKMHEQTHNISIKSYRLVRTNKINDQIFHNIMFRSRNQFIMYQCRNCLVSVDKTQRHIHRCVFHNITKCSHCGLLFTEQDSDTHRNRHEDLKIFNTNRISVVLFGKQLHKVNQIITPSFKGKIYDYTFYKCTACEVCIRNQENIFKHKCVSDESKFKCPTCDLYFLRIESACHGILHETNTEFDHSNLNISLFDVRVHSRDQNNLLGNKENSSVQNAVSTTQKLNDNSKTIPKRLETCVKLFKCDCGLHFIDKPNARNHYNNCHPNMKISKQLCTKCELLFTPAELFTHLLYHHGDKNQEFKFAISFICKDVKKTQLYKCVKCKLHFVHESEVNDHFDKCDESGIGGEKCRRCGLRFKLSSLYKNKHKSVCEKEYEINIISEVKNIETSPKEVIDDTNGVIDSFVTKNDMVLANEYNLTQDYLLTIDLSKYSNVLYKCDDCDVYYLTESTQRKHLHFLTVYDACNVCGLNFSLQSLARHKYIHHDKFNLKKDEFVIKHSNV